jgi:predicted dehydrogenase
LGDVYFITSSRVNLGLHQRDVSVIWDLAPHDFSILFDWLGEEPDHVQSFGRRCVQDCNPDVAFITMAFPSGTVAEMQLSWLSPVKLRRTLVVGSKKMLLYDDTEAVEKVKIFDHGVNVSDHGSFGEFQLSYRTGDIVSPRLATTEPLGAEARHFIECCMTGMKPKTCGQSGMRVVRALERAEVSLQLNGNYVRDPVNCGRRRGDAPQPAGFILSPDQMRIALPA